MRVYNCPQELIQQAASEVGVTVSIYPIRRKGLGVKLYPSWRKPYTVKSNIPYERTVHKVPLVVRDKLAQIWFEQAPRYPQGNGSKLHWTTFARMSPVDPALFDISETQVLFLRKIADGLNGIKRPYIRSKRIAKYQRSSPGYRDRDRAVGAVCWHGFRDFFFALFRRKPDAHIEAARAYYRNAKHFEQIYPSTASGGYDSMCWCSQVQAMEVEL